MFALENWGKCKAKNKNYSLFCDQEGKTTVNIVISFFPVFILGMVVYLFD